MSESATYQSDPSLSAGTKVVARPSGSPLEILLIFLRLGCTCFGGPIAHLGYFRAEFVERRKWLTERAYADLVALSQFLRGPASSQTGFGIGLMPGGLLRGLAAWTGFTMPSAVLLVLSLLAREVLPPLMQALDSCTGSSSLSSPLRRRPSWAWREACARIVRAPRSRPSL